MRNPLVGSRQKWRIPVISVMTWHSVGGVVMKWVGMDGIDMK